MDKKRAGFVSAFLLFTVILAALVAWFCIDSDFESVLEKMSNTPRNIEYYSEIKESLETGRGLSEEEVEELLRRHDKATKELLEKMRSQQ